MATSKSAEKRARQNRERRQYNNSWKTKYRTAKNQLNEAIENGADEETVEELGREAISIADKISAKDIVHENKAARWKSRVQTSVNEYSND